MPRKRLDNDTLKVKSRIIAPARYRGMKNFPTTPEGNIIPGTYVVEFYIDFNAKRYSKNKIYEFEGPPTINKKIKIEGDFGKIQHYSNQSDTPTMWNDSDISLEGKTATYEKYVDEVLVETIDVTEHLALDKTGVTIAVLPNNYMLQGLYGALFEVDYTDADGDVVFASTTQGVEVRDLITPSCIDPRNGQIVRKGDPDYDLICGIRGKWQLEWEPQTLTPIDIIISDPHNPAEFPTVEQMKGQNVKPILTDMLENVQYELQYTEQEPIPAFPATMYTTKTTRTYEYTAINLTVDGQVLLKPAELRILNQRLIRRINFNSPELRPNVYREILWEPATLTDDIVVQDHQSSSFPSANDLMQDVRAYWVDEQGQEQNLTVNLLRPQKDLYRVPNPYHFDATSGEVNTYIPKTWPIRYEATIPASAGTFKRYPAITSRKNKNYIIEDTIPPEIVTSNGWAFPPSHLELGTSYDQFLKLWSTTPVDGKAVPNLYALDKPRHNWSPWGGVLYPFKNFAVTLRVLHITENREITPAEFNALQHGEFFRIEVVTVDDSGNENTGQVYMIECVDTTTPTLTLTGLVIPMSPTPPDLNAGVTTFDLSEPVNVEYTVPAGTDWNTPAVLSIPYTATDAVGLQTTRNRTIVVFDPTRVRTPPTPTPSVAIVPVVADDTTRAVTADFAKADDDLYYEWKLDGVVVVPSTKGSDGGYEYTTPIDSQNKILEVTVHDEPTIGASIETATNNTTVGAGVIPACGAVVPDALRLTGQEDIRTFTDSDWTENLITRDGDGNPVSVDYVVHSISIQWLKLNAMNPDGTIIHTVPGLTAFNFNVDVWYGDRFLHCVNRYIEIYDSIAPVITLPPDPIVLNITQATTVEDVVNMLKTTLIITDNFSTLANIDFTIGSFSTIEATTEGTYTKTVRAEDQAGNQTDMEITFQLIITDTDGDGISDFRDEFPTDDLYTTDIDGDGVGDDDSVVIWHHDFYDTLNYLSVREAEINQTLTLNNIAQQIQYADVVTGPETAQKRSVAMQDGFHLSTSNADSSPVAIDNTSLSFTLALEAGIFEIDNSDTGMFISFNGSGNSGYTNGRLEIKIKKLQHTQTNAITYRFSIYHILQNTSLGSNWMYANSSYSNGSGNSLSLLNATDLTDYTVLNDIGVDELYGDHFAGYEIGKYITNFDLPVDSKLHAYTFAFEKRIDIPHGYQFAFYADGELKQILFKTDTRSLAITRAPVAYNLYGFDSSFMSDYIWSTITDTNDIINIHGKLLNTTYPASTLYNDDDGDGLTNMQEIMSGLYDHTEANTDQNEYAPNYTDGADDYVEYHLKSYYTPLSTTAVAGSGTYSNKQLPSSEDFSQDVYVNYFNRGVRFSSAQVTSDEFTMAFWWYNDGSFNDWKGTVFNSEAAQDNRLLGWTWQGVFLTQGGSGSNPANFTTDYNALAASEGPKWKHFAAVFDKPNGEIKIYINAQLYDTVTGYTGTGAAQQVNYRDNYRQSFNKWTDLGMWNAKFDQSKITQIYNAGKDLEYHLRGQYPAIVTDSQARVTGFNYESVAADYTDELLKAGLTTTTPVAGQEVTSVVVNKYQLDAAISATESTPGNHEIVVETTTNQGVKTYTRRTVVIAAPYQGFIEELPFMDDNPIGTPVNFTNLSTMSEMPVAVNANQLHFVPDVDAYVGPAAQVLVPASNFNHITNKFTFSFWIKGYMDSGAASQKIFTTNVGETGHTLSMTKHYWQARKWHIASGLSIGTYTFSNGFNDWTHIVVTYSFENGLRIYTNGNHSDTRPANAENRSLDLTDTIQIGGLASHGYSIDSVQFEDWELNDTQVSTAYALGRTHKVKSPPVITLTDDSRLTTLVGDYPTQTDPGATAVDFNGASLSVTSDWNIVVGSSPDVGLYDVTYTTDPDPDGFVTTITRTVIVTVALKGFIEELPFMPSPVGTADFDFLEPDTSTPKSSSSVTVPGSQYSHIGDTYTLSFWLNRGHMGNGAYFMIIGGIAVRFHNQQININNGLGYNNVSFGYNVSGTNVWHHVVIIVETTNNDVHTQIYLNGSRPINNTRAKTADLDWTGNIELNSLNHIGIDSVELVDYALTTPTGINNLYAAGRHTLMSEIMQSNPPVVHNLTHEPILASPGASSWHSSRSDTDLYSFNRWLGKQHCPLPNPCNDKYTLSIWFKVLGGFGPLILSNYDSVNDGFRLEVHNDYLLYDTCGGGNTNYNWPIDKNTSFADGEWHHVVATFDHAAGTRSLYLDGAKLTGGDDTFTPNSGNPENKHFLFYRKNGGAQFYDYQSAQSTRKFGNVHLLNYVLSESQISDIYNAGHLGITIDLTDVPDAPDSYVEDVEDGNGVITATSNWNTVIGATPSAGTYTVTYSATDSNGVTTDLDVSVVVL